MLLGADREAETAKQCLRDVVALSLLPGIWAGAQPVRIAESVAAAVFNSLDAEFVLVCFVQPEGLLSVVQIDRHRTNPDLAGTVAEEILQWARTHDPEELLLRPNPLRPGHVQVAARPLGAFAELGVLAAAFAAPTAPTSSQNLLLNVAASQAAAAVQNASVLRSLRASEQREREINAELSGRIAELQKAYAEIRNSRQAALNLMEDAVHAQEALRRSEQAAQAASRAKDDFLAALSHELRTPLTPVLLTATALESDPTLRPEIQEDVSMIRRNVELEARIIDDLLDLTTVSRGKLVMHPAVCDLHELIGYAQEMVMNEAAAKGVDLDLQLNAHDHRVMADPGRLQQVAWNLLKNALKFTDRGGRVTVATGNSSSMHVELTVRDTGIGITRTALGRIFEAFDQGDLTGHHRFGGLGLGLAISRAIIDLHGGELTADSEGPGKGSTFTVRLKLASPEATQAPPPEEGKQPLRPLRLLLVEDHASTLAALVRLLESDGHQVVPATSMNQALAIAKVHTFDAVISDLGLPDASGFELMSHLNRTYGWPGLALSGFGMEEDVRRAHAAGFAAHLTKPVPVQKLRQELHRLVEPK